MSVEQKIYYVPKRSGTHADPMAAVGLASFLSTAGESQVIDDPHYDSFSVHSASIGDVSRELGQHAGYRYFRPNEKATVPAELNPNEVFDYPTLKAAAKMYREGVKKGKKGATVEIVDAIAQQAPPDDFYLYQALNSLQGDDATNKAYLWIRRMTPSKWVTTIESALRDLSERRVPIVDLDLDLVQMFSPHAAKGYARLKPDSTGRGDKTKDAWAEPFFEWLRFRGFFEAACTFSVGAKNEHTRLLYPIPANIGVRTLRMVVADLRKEVIFGSAPKVDCLATLRLAILLIRHSEKMGSPKRPNRLVSGVTITHYQSLGQAKAVTRIENLAIPDWFPLETSVQAEFWCETLEEHFGIVRRLRDENSDELDLIFSYRKFLEQRGPHSVALLLNFLEGYGIFVMRQRGQKTWFHRQFTMNHLEAIVAESQYSEILANPGFKKVAAALRSATVSAQTRKKNKQEHREIRYDVLPEFKRKRTLPGADHLVEAVTAFVTSFNAESAKRLDNPKAISGNWRITTEELADFLALFDNPKNNPATIGAMLTAYATCREVKDVDVAVEPEAEETAESAS